MGIAVKRGDIAEEHRLLFLVHVAVVESNEEATGDGRGHKCQCDRSYTLGATGRKSKLNIFSFLL